MQMGTVDCALWNPSLHLLGMSQHLWSKYAKPVWQQNAALMGMVSSAFIMIHGAFAVSWCCDLGNGIFACFGLLRLAVLQEFCHMISMTQLSLGRKQCIYPLQCTMLRLG